ncbi:uncharacterized protein V1516DRAFT_672000 [Lipomyces oligophaga]|uniref:uncharacterized protein n=1 Tax=Lipomyces oligophaga TaxID=45792 RepID=UPI0034CD8F38
MRRMNVDDRNGQAGATSSGPTTATSSTTAIKSDSSPLVSDSKSTFSTGFDPTNAILAYSAAQQPRDANKQQQQQHQIPLGSSMVLPPPMNSTMSSRDSRPVASPTTTASTTSSSGGNSSSLSHRALPSSTNILNGGDMTSTLGVDHSSMMTESDNTSSSMSSMTSMQQPLRPHMLMGAPTLPKLSALTSDVGLSRTGMPMPSITSASAAGQQRPVYGQIPEESQSSQGSGSAGQSTYYSQVEDM